MSKILSYSIFGVGAQQKDSADFRSYLRGLELNLRVADALYPDWQVHWTTDVATAEAYSAYFDYHVRSGKVQLLVKPSAPLCEMMLWRMTPAFMSGVERFICRDTDSLITYRDANAVKYWEQSGKVALAITDSISHNVALMGGMVGFRNPYLVQRMGVNSFSDLLSLDPSIDYTRKGADQDFMNRHILPRVSDSITEFYVLGLPQSFRGDCRHVIPDLEAAPAYCRELDGYGFHLGASGFQTDAVIKWLCEHGQDNAYYDEIESRFGNVFYWQL